jgi:hypothetical protein
MGIKKGEKKPSIERQRTKKGEKCMNGALDMVKALPQFPNHSHAYRRIRNHNGRLYLDEHTNEWLSHVRHARFNTHVRANNEMWE